MSLIKKTQFVSGFLSVKSVQSVVVFLVFCGVTESAEPPNDGFPLPDGAIHRFGNRQMRHPNGVYASAVSPDGKYLATADYYTIVVWDLKTLSAKRTFSDFKMNNYGIGGRGGHLGFLSDSKSLLVSVRPEYAPFTRNDEPVLELAQILDVETGKKKFGLRGHYGYNVATWVAAEGKEIALYTDPGGQGEIRFFSGKDGKELRSIRTPYIYSSPWIARNGDVIAFQRINGVSGPVGLTVLNASIDKELFAVPDGHIVQAALSPDGELVAYQDKDNNIRAYDMKAEKEIASFKRPADGQPGPMLVSKDKQTLYFGSNQGHLYRWNLKDNKVIPGLDRHSLWTLSNLAIDPEESTLFSMGYDKVIRRWDVRTGKQLPLPEGYHTIVVMTPAVDGKHLFVGDHATQLDKWDLTTGQKVQSLNPIMNGGINCLAQSPDGRWLACGRVVQDVQLWDLATGKVDKEILLEEKPLRNGNDQVSRVQFSPDGKVLYIASPKTGITAVEVPDGKKAWNAPGTGPLLAVDPLGRWIASAGGFADPPVRWAMLDAKTGVVISKTEINQEDIEPKDLAARYSPYTSDIVVLPDGSRIYSGHQDGHVRYWDTASRRQIGKFRVHQPGEALSLGVSRDGKWLAVGGSGKGISLHEVATGAEITRFAGHHSGVTQVAFTRDSKGLISNADLAPVLWTLEPKNAQDGKLSADEIWTMLASDKSASVYQLQWALARRPEATIKLFTDKIKPAELTIPREQFDKWVASLDDSQFRVREAAERNLTQAGFRVPIDWLRKALAEAKGDELVTRLNRVVAQREKPDANEWRLSRAVKVLELAGSNEAMGLLKSWADSGASDLAIDAKRALKRHSSK